MQIKREIEELESRKRAREEDLNEKVNKLIKVVVWLSLNQ